MESGDKNRSFRRNNEHGVKKQKTEIKKCIQMQIEEKKHRRRRGGKMKARK